MTSITFNNLPEAVGLLIEKIDRLEKHLLEQHVPQNVQTKQLLSIKEASEFLNLAVPTVYSMVSRGDLPYMKRSKRLYFDRTELTLYLKEGRQKTNAEIQADAILSLKGRRV